MGWRLPVHAGMTFGMGGAIEGKVDLRESLGRRVGFLVMVEPLVAARSCFCVLDSNSGESGSIGSREEP